MAQNLVSASITPAQQEEILTLINSLKSKLSFLKSFQPDEITSMLKAGNVISPLLDVANDVVEQHPEILPQIFDKVEYKKDYELYQMMKPILIKFNELHETLNRTNIAVGSDLFVETLDVYSSVKQNKDKVPGLNATYEKMKEFFKKNRTKNQNSIE